jgi:endoribonuclease LACTB2
MSMQIANLGSESANFYLILVDDIPAIMIDCGWANTMNVLKGKLEQLQIQLSDVKYLLVTHYHPDHAGLVRELKSSGVKLVVYETQLPLAEELSNALNLTERYLEMQQKSGLKLKAGQSREFLKKLRIDGEIVPIAGHTHDSVALVLDEGVAFTGDLAFEVMIAETDTESAESWKRIRQMGVHSVYPGHGKVQKLRLTQ